MDEKKLTNIVYDANYTNFLHEGGFPTIRKKEGNENNKKTENKDIVSNIKKSISSVEESGNKFFTNITTTLFPSL